MADQTAEQKPAQFADDVGSIVASQISAMIDDELQNRENHWVLRRLCQDRDTQDRWERYHLIRDVLQDHLPDKVDVGFAARIRCAIESEPVPRLGVKSLPAWYKPVTGFALAASVVLVALFGLKLTQTDVMQPIAQTAQLTAAPPALAVSSAALPIRTVASVQNSDPAGEPVEARLGSYLVNHNGYASMNSMHGVLPYVRMVGYQTEGYQAER